MPVRGLLKNIKLSGKPPINRAFRVKYLKLAAAA